MFLERFVLDTKDLTEGRQWDIQSHPESLSYGDHNLVFCSFKNVWVFAMYRKGDIVLLSKRAFSVNVNTTEW